MLKEKFVYLYNYIVFKRTGLEFPQNARLRGRIHIIAQSNAVLQVGKDARLSIGEGTGISNSILFCREQIVIGNNVNIGVGCLVYDTDMHSINYRERSGLEKETVSTRPVEICDGAWIGGSCIILKGVTIGQRAVVGAGSIVTKDVPADELWAGNPVKFIRKLENNYRDG